MQKVNAVLSNTVRGSAKLNQLLGLTGRCLGMNLSLLAWNKKHKWDSNACGILKVCVCSGTPVDPLADNNELAVRKTHLELINELPLRNWCPLESKLRQESVRIAAPSNELLERRPWLFVRFHRTCDAAVRCSDLLRIIGHHSLCKSTRPRGGSDHRRPRVHMSPGCRRK